MLGSSSYSHKPDHHKALQDYKWSHDASAVVTFSCLCSIACRESRAFSFANMLAYSVQQVGRAKTALHDSSSMITFQKDVDQKSMKSGSGELEPQNIHF